MGIFSGNLMDGYDWRTRHGKPKNARQLFQCVVTEQFFSLIPVNFLALLFWLPVITWSVLCVFRMTIDMQNGQTQDIVGCINAWVVGLIPCIALTGPMQAGLSLLLRNWAREEYTPVLATFGRGLRQNWKQSLAVSAFSALLPAALWFSYQASCFKGGESLASVAAFVLCCIVASVFALMQQFLGTLMVTYDLPLSGHVRNALLIALMNWPSGILVLLGSLFFVLLYIAFCLIAPEKRMQLLLIPFIYYAVCGFAFTGLIQASYANKLCKKYFHKEAEAIESKSTPYA